MPQRVFAFTIFLLLSLLPSLSPAQDLILRIPVTGEGVYRIAYNDLGYYGQPYGIDPRWSGMVIAGTVLLCGMALLYRKRRRFSDAKKGAAFLFLIVCWTILSAGAAAWASGGEEDLRVVRSDEYGLTVKLILPSYRIGKSALRGVSYDTIEVPDYGLTREKGRPELPMRGTLIGIPEKGKVSLKIAPGEYDSYKLWLPPTLPSPARGEGYNESAADGIQEDVFYPGTLAVEGFTGYMRDQRVMQILFYPVQYNPVTGEVRIYKRIKVTVDFEEPNRLLKKAIPAYGDGGHSKSRRPNPSLGGAYEKLLKSLLLNYP